MPRPPMTLFVDPQDVILRMQLSPDLTGIEDVVSSGIAAAQLHVERIIDGKLLRQVQDARFYLDSEAFSGIQPGGLYRLEVPSGLVRQDVPQVVTFSDQGGPFLSHSAIDESMMQFDYRRGYLYVDGNTYGDNYIRIQCETGFDPGDHIPDAIYEAIIALVPMVFNANQTTNRADEAKNQYVTLTDHANLLLQPYTRTQGFTFRSI